MLLTWHGTLVLAPEDGLAPFHHPIEAMPGMALPLAFAAPAEPRAGVFHPAFGLVDLVPGLKPGTLQIRRGSLSLAAEATRRRLRFEDDPSPAAASFLPVDAALLVILRRLLTGVWRFAFDSAPLAPHALRLHPSFILQIGGQFLDLTSERPVPDPARPGALLLPDGTRVLPWSPSGDAEEEDAFAAVEARAAGIHRALFGAGPDAATREALLDAYNDGVGEAADIACLDRALASPDALDRAREAALAGRRPCLLITAHLQAIGDLSGFDGDWLGFPGSFHAVEGFSVRPVFAVSGVVLRYRALDAEGIGPWAEDGVYVGTRGQSQQLRGFAAQLAGPEAAGHVLRCEARFVGGGRTWVTDGSPCASPDGAALEAFRLTLLPA